jgi:hypothetical protein
MDRRVDDVTRHPNYRSPGTAILYSGLGTVLPLGLVISGSPGLQALGGLAGIFTPSFGQWYSGAFLTWGMGLRLLGVTYTVVIAAGAGDDSPPADVYTPALLLVGTGILVDFATAGLYAKRHNAKLMLAPTRLDSQAGSAWGLAAVGSF